MTFNDFDLNPLINKAIVQVGYEVPTPIQQKAIPIILANNDLIACAQTGTGKTAAFSIPMLNKLAAKKQDGKIRALILTPTRELAIQIHENVIDYSKFLDLKTTVIYGGVKQKNQVTALANTNILIATPGRLLDLMNQKYITLKDVEILILDEADRMLDMGFIHDVKKVVKAVSNKRQTLLFSATMPKEIKKLAQEFLTNPMNVSVTPESSTVEVIKQELYHVNKNDKKKLLIHLLRTDLKDGALVFTRTKANANRVVKLLIENGIEAKAIHGNKSQAARVIALQEFKDKKIEVLVATDIAARGIDIDLLDCVVNYEIPNIFETYVHRIGRSGRAGAKGRAISFCDYDEREYITGIEKLIKQEIPLMPVNCDLDKVELFKSAKTPRTSERRSSDNGNKIKPKKAKEKKVKGISGIRVDKKSDESKENNSEQKASKPRDSKPRDSKPRDSKPRDSKPRDSKPRDSKPRDTKSNESKDKRFGRNTEKSKSDNQNFGGNKIKQRNARNFESKNNADKSARKVQRKG